MSEQDAEHLIIVGGPNEAGKSTLYQELTGRRFLTGPFLNPDEIASGLGSAPCVDRAGPARQEAQR